MLRNHIHYYTMEQNIEEWRQYDSFPCYWVSNHGKVKRIYTNGNEIFLGEMTNFPENLRGNFIPKNSEKQISKLFFKNH